MELLKTSEIDDGREDIILRDSSTNEPLLIIKQEFYRSVGESYDKMKTTEGIAKFLITIGMLMAKTEKAKHEKTH